jgi:hypothetical protein
VIYYEIAPFNEEARRFVMGVVQQMGQKVRHGLNGMRLLDDLATENVSEDIVRRIKWAVIFEIASWFIGVGEIRAAVAGAVAFGRGFEVARLLRGAETAAGLFRAADRAADVGHVADVVRVTTRVAEIEGATSRVGRVVEVLAQPGALGSEEQAWRLLSHLPESDIDRLARAVGDTDLHDIRDLAALARRHPEIAAEAQRVLERAQCLAALEAKSGGRLSDNVARGFEALATRSGFENAELLDLVNALPEENVELFMRAINVMPPEAFGRGVGARSYSFFQGLAAHPGAMEFMAGHGYETFAAIYRRGGFNWSRLDEDLQALRIIERSMLRRNLKTGYQQVLEGLRQGSPVAEATLANARSAIGAARRLSPEVTLLPEELELMFRAIGAEEEASRARLLDELAGRLRGRASDADIERLRRRIRDRNVTQRARAAEALAPDLQARRVQELDNEALLLDEVEGRTLEMSEGPDRRRTEQWLYRLDLDEELARAEARQLRAAVEASPALRAVA